MPKQFRKIYVLGKQGIVSRVTVEPNGKTAEGKTARIYRHKAFEYDSDKCNAPMASMLTIAELVGAMAASDNFAGAAISLVTLDRIAWIARMGYANIVKKGLPVEETVDEVVLANIKAAEARESEARWSEDYINCIRTMLTSFAGLKDKGITMSIFDVHDDYDKARIYDRPIDKDSQYVVRHDRQTKQDIQYTWGFCPDTPVLELNEDEDAVGL